MKDYTHSTLPKFSEIRTESFKVMLHGTIRKDDF